MINVSKQVDYALQLIIALSDLDKGEFLSLRIFSNESTISFLFLQRIARSLKKAQIIDATRGVHGGYFLVADPHKITLKQLIEAIEGRFGITTCSKDTCPRQKGCTSKKVFLRVNKKIEHILDTTYILEK